MNLAVRRFLLFFFSIAALSACEDPKDIGIELQDENLIGTTFTDTITVNTATVLLNDSILSFRQSPALLGKYTDPALGTVTATTFAELSLGGSNLNFGTNPVADSLVLTLTYSSMYGTGTNNALALNVHRLTEGFSERASYFTNSNLQYQTEPLGTATIIPQMLKKVKTGEDSTAAKNIVRVKLPQALANEFIAQSGQAAFQSQTAFNNFFKGLAIVPQATPSKILFLNFAADTSEVTLFYKNGENQKKSYSFKFNDTNTRYFSNVEGDRTGTAVAALQAKASMIPSEETGGETYVQATTQLLTKLTIPHITKLKEQEGNIIINRAELVVPIKNASRGTYLQAPPQLVMYRTNNTNQILRNTAGTPLAVQVDRSASGSGTNFPAVLGVPDGKDYYTVNITPYAQALILGNQPNNGVLLAPAMVTYGSQGQAQISTEPRPYRTILVNSEERPVKLLLYYSKLN